MQLERRRQRIGVGIAVQCRAVGQQAAKHNQKPSEKRRQNL
jgi:hypothetical protein